MRILTRSDIEPLIGHAEVIGLMRRVFGEYAAGRVHLPDRSALAGHGPDDTVLIMPAGVPAVGGLGTKVISIFPSNAARGLPTISSQIVLLDPETGSARAIMDGSYITELRTAAASALATDMLSRKDTAVLGVFGAGAHAKNHILAMLEVREIRTVRIFSRTPERAQGLCDVLRSSHGEKSDFIVAESAASAVSSSDVIVTATTSVDPVFDGTLLRPGTHINAIGSYKPHVRELDDATVSRASIFVDIREHALKEAGDLIGPIERGLITAESIVGDLGQLVTGACRGRRNDEEITLFKSVGAAMEDIIVAAAVWERVR